MQVSYLENFAKYNEIRSDKKENIFTTIQDLGEEYSNRLLSRKSFGMGAYSIKLYTMLRLAIPSNTKVEKYTLDFAIFEGGRLQLNIEVDGERYHKTGLENLQTRSN